jgi:hypothetical protein
MQATTANTLRTVYTPDMLKSMETNLTDDEAFAICGTIKGDDFARSLYDQHQFVGTKRMSGKQIFYAHKKAVESVRPKQAPAGEKLRGDMLRIKAMFDSAAQHLQRPAIHLFDNGTEFRIYPALETSKNPGFLYVRSMQSYFGKVSPTGEFFKSGDCPDSTLALLRRFATNPEDEAAKYGRLMGVCCFCHRPLSTIRCPLYRSRLWKNMCGPFSTKMGEIV